MPNINQNYYNISNSTLLDQSILDVFVLQDLIDQDDATRLKKQLKTNRQIEDFLCKNRIVTRDTINKAYSIILKLPYVELRNVRISDELKSIVTEKIAKRFGIIAFGLEEGMIRIAISRPADILTGFQNGLKDLFEKRKLEVELFVTGETDFLEVTKQYRQNDKNSLLLKKGSLPVVYLRNQPISESYLKKFPKEFVEKYRLVVFDQNKRGHYLIACEQPDSPITMKILDFIKKENGVNIEKFATSRDDIEYVIKKISGEAVSKKETGNVNSITIDSIDQRGNDQSVKNKAGSSGADLANIEERSNTSSKSVIKGLLDSLVAEDGPEFTMNEVEPEDELPQPIKKEIPDLAQEDKAAESEILGQNRASQSKENIVKNQIDKQADIIKIGAEKDSESAIPTASDIAKAQSEPVDTNASENDLGSLIKEDIVDEKMLDDIVKEGSVPKIVAAVINYALVKRASDIHVEPENKSLRIRCRVDGILKDAARAPLKLHPPFISRIKILSKLKIDESRIPQDGRFDVEFKNHEVDVRVSTLPTVHGEKVVMRVLDKSQGILSLEDLGMQGSAFEATNLSIQKPYGIILSTGPTGSGKSTTLYAVLNRISVPGINIVTLEDPVEYEIPGVNQCQIKPEIGFTFASGLRSILRQDPNVIMVGEIRDAETAAMATHAALTGHLVLSTLHTNDTAGALPRLINMGVEPFLITSAINLVIAQRLVRRVCPKCREEIKVPQKLMDELMAEMAKIPANNIKDKERIPAEPKLYHGKGCPECNQGFRGRVGIYEVMTITPAIEELAIAKRSANEIKETAIKEGMITMKQDGIIKAFNGETTVDEVFQAVINN